MCLVVAKNGLVVKTVIPQILVVCCVRVCALGTAVGALDHTAQCCDNGRLLYHKYVSGLNDK